MAKKSVSASTKKKKNFQKKTIFDVFPEDEFSKDSVMQGMILRPLVFMVAFITFIISVFFLLIPDYKWAGSFIIFSFIFNIYAIHQSFSDEPSMFRTMNLAFKLIVFIAEIVFFNWVFTRILF